MTITILAAESLGVRGLCCRVDTPDRCIVIDPGLALGFVRHGLMPHPRQVAAGRLARRAIVAAVSEASDLVFSHLHGDHVPLTAANPYQLAFADLPAPGTRTRAWGPALAGLPPAMQQRYDDLQAWLGGRLLVAEGHDEPPLKFSTAVPHGPVGSPLGTVMMTRIEAASEVFVHASDIQLLDAETVSRILDWAPTTVLAGGPPLYLDRLDQHQRELAWDNAVRLARGVPHLVLDHHLLRDLAGQRWLDELGRAVGRRVLCAADHNGQPRQMLEAQRDDLYRRRPVDCHWHQRYTRRFRPTVDGDTT